MERRSVPERLRLARLELGWNQADLARKLGVTASTVSRHESGRKKVVDLLYVERVAKALGVNPQWLLGAQEIKIMEPEASYGELDTRERRLLEHWRSIDERDRTFIEGFLEGRRRENRDGPDD